MFFIVFFKWIRQDILWNFQKYIKFEDQYTVLSNKLTWTFLFWANDIFAEELALFDIYGLNINDACAVSALFHICGKYQTALSK